MSVIDRIKEKWPDLSDIQRLRAGGQKEVYRATSKHFGDVAIKVVKDCSGNSRAGREIEIMKRCNTPYIPKLFDYQFCSFDDSERLVIIEEFVNGNTLRDALQQKRMTVNEVIILMAFLLGAVAKLEEISIVHRDIKPDNILVCGKDSYKLIDFGIARDLNQESLTATCGLGPNTPGYAPPEQFNNVKVDVSSKTDLFAIGVVAYEAITGENPYIHCGDNQLDIYLRTNTMPTPDLSISVPYDKELFLFIRSLMSRKPHGRPPSAKLAHEWFTEIVMKRCNLIRDGKEKKG